MGNRIYDLAAGVVDGDEGNMTFTGPASVPGGDPFDIRLLWDDPLMTSWGSLLWCLYHWDR